MTTSFVSSIPFVVHIFVPNHVYTRCFGVCAERSTGYHANAVTLRFSFRSKAVISPVCLPLSKRPAPSIACQYS